LDMLSKEQSYIMEGKILCREEQEGEEKAKRERRTWGMNTTPSVQKAAWQSPKDRDRKGAERTRSEK